MISNISRLLGEWGKYVRCQSSDLGTSHGCTADGVRCLGAPDPGTGNILARGENVDKLSIVGELGADILVSSGANGASLWGGSWRRGRSILILVTSCNGDKSSRCNRLADGVVGDLTERSTKGHGQDGASDVTVILCVLNSPVDALQDTGVAARAVCPENLDGDEVCLFGLRCIVSV